jgi:hypothetical protein
VEKPAFRKKSLFRKSKNRNFTIIENQLSQQPEDQSAPNQLQYTDKTKTYKTAPWTRDAIHFVIDDCRENLNLNGDNGQ